MIDRQGNQIFIECDSCADVFEGDEGAEFSRAWGAAQREGWRSRMIAEKWVHSCPSCAKVRS